MSRLASVDLEPIERQRQRTVSIDRPALSTSLTTPRTTEPAGTSTRPSCSRSTTVVVSKRCSTAAVSELNVVRSRTSTSCPAGIVPGADSLTVAGPLGACELT